MTDFEKKENISLTAVITVLEKMDEKLDRIDGSLHDKDGLCERITIAETKGGSTQKELSEHKANHWQQAFIIVGLSGVIASVAVVLVPFLCHIK
jgi:hypothetical protein